MNAFTVQDAPLNMAPTGIATFAKVPICYNIHEANADVAILGAPFDLAIQGKTGCRLGPRGIRNASTRFRMKKGGNYDPERNKSYLDTDLWRVVDCGDCDYVTGDLTATNKNLEEAVRILAKQGVMPIVLGGDCSVGHQTVKGLDCYSELDIIHFDSHLDWTKPLNGQPYFNGSPMRNNSTLPYVKNMIHLGIRGIGSSGPADFAEARANGDKIYSVKDYRRVGIEEILKDLQPGRNTFIHFDIDAMDYPLSKGTGSPMLGGFTYNEATEMLEAIANHCHVVGMAMTEVAPQYDDEGDTTCYTAARLTCDLMGFATKAREK